MATVTLTITDEGEEGELGVQITFVGGFDADSEAHTTAADLAMRLQEGKPQ